MGYYNDETDLTAEERRLRLLAEMGSPYLGSRPDADLGTVDSGGAFGLMPQGYNPQPDVTTSLLGSPYMDPGQARVSANPPWMDPGQTAGGLGRDYTDPPPRLGNLFRKPGEPEAPEQDGILYNGTRSPAGRGVLAAETPTAAIPAGPIASPEDVNLQGANGQDRSNAPKSPDMPKTAPPASLPTMAGALGTGPAGAYSATPPRVGTSPAPVTAPTAGAAAPNATATAAPASQLPQPQIAAMADGLSRKPGSPAAMNWLSENADLLIGLGAGLLSGKNIGEGIIAGLKMANESKHASAKAQAEAEKHQAENLKKAAAAALLSKAFNMPSDMAMASADNADLVKRAGQIIYPDPTSQDWVREKDANGTDILRNTKTGDMKAAPKADTPEPPARPLTPQEKQVWGIPTDDNRPYAITAGKAPTLIGGQAPFESPAQAASKAEALARTEVTTERGKKLASGRMQAITDNNRLTYVNELLSAVEPGTVTNLMNTLRDKTGLALDKNAGPTQALQAAFEEMANNMHKSGQGPMTDKDREAFLKMVPSLHGTREGNAIIMDTMRGVAQYQLEATRLGGEWESGKISGEQLRQQLEAIPDPMARFRQFQAERAGALGATGASPGAPVAPSAASGELTYDRRTKSFR